jgi:hypothetical protein
MNTATALAQNQPSTRIKAIFMGGLVAGIIDAVDGVIAYGTQGLNSIQVLQYIASGAMGESAFQGGLATAALVAAFHFVIAWLAAAVFVFASRRLPALKKHAVPCGAAVRNRSVLLHELPRAPFIGGGDRSIQTRSLS